jgi:hypothetical protein
MGLKAKLAQLKRKANEGLDSFELLDGSSYWFDKMEAFEEMWLHAYDVQLGDAFSKASKATPEIWLKICEAKDPAAVLERFRSENPSRAFLNVAETYDKDTLINERRLVPLTHEEPVEDLSSQRKHD